MNKIIVFFLLITHYGFGQNISIYCEETTSNEENFSKGLEYKKGIERVISNLDNAPVLVERDKISELIEFIQDEYNLSRDFGFGKNQIISKSEVDYIVFSNFSTNPLRPKSYLEIECVKVSGEASLSKYSFPIVVFSNEELENLLLFEKKLESTLGNFSFIDKIGIVENKVLEEINKRIDNSSEEVLALSKQLKAVTDYIDMAELNIVGQGKLRSTDGSIIFSSELSRLMESVVSVKENSYEVLFTKEAENTINIVIEKYPRFPFGHYVKAVQLKRKNDVSWKKHAKNAVKIFEYTTTIKSCDGSHLQALINSRMWLSRF